MVLVVVLHLGTKLTHLLRNLPTLLKRHLTTLMCIHHRSSHMLLRCHLTVLQCLRTRITTTHLLLPLHHLLKVRVTSQATMLRRIQLEVMGVCCRVMKVEEHKAHLAMEVCPIDMTKLGHLQQVE